MARKSRKNLPQPEQVAASVLLPELEEAKMPAAIYGRLSVEDEEKEESMETQIALVQDYINRSSELSYVDTYFDNGFTGTNFKRPAFTRLMNDVRQKKIKCIVVKDLSRFGRNYLEAGYYIETVFPFLGVRLIAVTDNFDSTRKEDMESLALPIRNAIIRSFIDYAGSTITNKLETLMAGGCIVQRVDENLTYDYLHSSEDNLWSTLYLTGYLTKAREEDYKGELPDGMVALMIPNAEIKEIFETTVIKWFDDSTKKWNRNALFDAVWNGDSEGITREMNALLRRTISYHDYREDFYHAFLAGIFTVAGYMVDSNKEHGEGRSDVVVYDSINARVAIFEAKYTKVLENLESECDIALQQIDDRMYAKEYEDDYDQILCYGISFFKKRCMVKKK